MSTIENYSHLLPSWQSVSWLQVCTSGVRYGSTQLPFRDILSYISWRSSVQVLRCMVHQGMYLKWRQIIGKCLCIDSRGEHALDPDWMVGCPHCYSNCQCSLCYLHSNSLHEIEEMVVSSECLHWNNASKNLDTHLQMLVQYLTLQQGKNMLIMHMCINLQK